MLSKLSFSNLPTLRLLYSLASCINWSTNKVLSTNIRVFCLSSNITPTAQAVLPNLVNACASVLISDLKLSNIPLTKGFW